MSFSACGSSWAHAPSRARPRAAAPTCAARINSRTSAGSKPCPRIAHQAIAVASLARAGTGWSGLQRAAHVGAAAEDAPGEGAWAHDEPHALKDIAGAHREEQTLYEIAQALGSSLGVEDAMALIHGKSAGSCRL